MPGGRGRRNRAASCSTQKPAFVGDNHRRSPSAVLHSPISAWKPTNMSRDGMISARARIPQQTRVSAPAPGRDDAAQPRRRGRRERHARPQPLYCRSVASPAKYTHATGGFRGGTQVGLMQLGNGARSPCRAGACGRVFEQFVVRVVRVGQRVRPPRGWSHSSPLRASTPSVSSSTSPTA